MKNEFWIQTRSGKAFPLIDPPPEAIDIEDVAWSLAFQCRFNGHTRKFYSIAEHSVRVARRLVAAHPEGGAALALMGLLHDAAEAYVGDVVLPLKLAMRAMDSHHSSHYDDVERGLEGRIMERFGIPLESRVRMDFRQWVKRADAELLATEKRDLLGPGEREWGDLVAQALQEKIHPWYPEEARNAFLAEFRKLTKLVEAA